MLDTFDRDFEKYDYLKDFTTVLSSALIIRSAGTVIFLNARVSWQRPEDQGRS